MTDTTTFQPIEIDDTPKNRNQRIEFFLKSRYDFRFNEIKGFPEYKEKGQEAFLPMTDYMLNTLTRELGQESYQTDEGKVKFLTTSPTNIYQILASSFSETINPIKQYFLQVKNPNGTDPIDRLARTITTTSPETWTKYLTKWMVGVVANSMTDQGCQNHLCLVLTGGQGKFKTTWLDNICPKPLNSYLYTGKIDPNGKDILTYIAEFFLVNIDDQLRQLNKKDENELKNLITTPSVKYRRPFGRYIQEYPHRASFMASVNGNDFLTDPTGSRRFLPFEAREIDIKAAQAMDVNHAWAYARDLWQNGFQYWFTAEEVNELHKHNEQFNVVTDEEQLIIAHFDRPEERHQATHFYQSAEIKAYIEKNTHQRLNSKKLGEALTKLNFEKFRKTNAGATKYVWSVIRKEESGPDSNPFDFSREAVKEQLVNALEKSADNRNDDERFLINELKIQVARIFHKPTVERLQTERDLAIYYESLQMSYKELLNRLIVN